ncbi:MAG: 50S ribosome-binding GTPase [Acidobacteria bacterium]|nr:50S ribosome-binding GTPase [Acidobacteriota bacterium]
MPADGIPHLALVGRSNVGKSSLINALTGTRLARTSAAPGKTRLANLYRLQVEGGPGGPGRWGVYLADLPGYGYARGGQASVAELAVIAESYFQLAGGEGPEGVEGKHQTGLPSNSSTPSNPSSESRYRIVGVFHLVDSRHPGLEADLDAGAWLDTIGVNRTVLATKIDKLSRSERAKNLKAFERQLGTAPLPISAVKGEGLDDLWTLIARLSRQR